MPLEFQSSEATARLTRRAGWMPALDQTGAPASRDWISLGDTQSLPYNRAAAGAQAAYAEVVEELVAPGTAAYVSRPRGLGPVNFVLHDDCASTREGPVGAMDGHLRQLRRRIRRHLEEEPLEDGVTHPAEGLVLDMISTSAEGRAALALLVGEADHPDVSSAVLRLVGRVGRSADGPWRRGLVALGLAAPSPALREAAVEAVEQWEDPGLLPLLSEHAESVSWLKTYIDAVIEDLSE